MSIGSNSQVATGMPDGQSAVNRMPLGLPLIWMRDPSELDPRRVVARGYDRIADRYASWVEQNPVDRSASRYLRIIEERLPAGAHLLDLGCGGGHRLLRLANRFQLTGVDISREQVRLARKTLPHARILQADMTRLEFPPRTFDVVTVLYAFNHLPFGELPAMLGRIAGWLRPGGLLVANMGSTLNRGSFEQDWLGAPTYFSGYDSATNLTFVHAAGLDVISARDETQLELLNGQATPVTFFWIVAQRPALDAA